MRMLQALTNRADASALTGDDEQRFLGSLIFDGNAYNYGLIPPSKADQPDTTFEGLIDAVHRQSSLVSSAVVARALLMSQVRFAYKRDFSSRQPGEMWGDRSLAVLERPGSTTRHNLLWSAEVDVSYSGTAYFHRDGNTVRRLAPNRMAALLGSDSEPEWDAESDTMRVPLDAEVVAYLYFPGGAANYRNASRNDFRVLFPDEVAVWKPEPDPIHFWRGQSWVTSCVREIVADGQAIDHQQKFFENAATPSLVFTMDPSTSVEKTRAFRDLIEKEHAGSPNAFKNLFVGGGADVKVVGSTLESLNLKDLVGGFETRVASRARVPGVVLGIREGYAGSSLNTGNYGSARRLWADGWFDPTVNGLCEALEVIVRPPSGSELAHRRECVLFLQEDRKDEAEINQSKAAAIRQLSDGGYDPATVVKAIAPEWASTLDHTGLLPVQVQPPGLTADAE